MTEYQVGSISNLINQKETEESTKKKKKTQQKDQNVLNALFSPADDSTRSAPLVVSNVPIPDESAKLNKKKRKAKRKAEEYSITSLQKVKKYKSVTELDDDEAERLLDPVAGDHAGEEEEAVIESEKVGRKLKKAELKNIKKNEALKNTPREGDDKIVLVKNLPIKVKRRSIQHLFAKFGKVQSVWLRCAAVADPAMPKKVAVIMQEFHPDRKSISAFVRFENAQSAIDSLVLTGTEFAEQHITVTLLRAPPTEIASSASSFAVKKDLSKGIFVGNLPFNVEDEALWMHFKECGRIVDVRVIRDKSNGMGKGFGYVNFDSADAVELALKLDQSSLSDRSIRVSRCKRNPKPASNPKEKKEQGAYKRVQDKKEKEEHRKGGGWITKMKQRKGLIKRNDSQNGGADKVQSFAGEVVANNGKVVKTSKVAKKSKEEQRRKIIAAKLAPKNSN